MRDSFFDETSVRVLKEIKLKEFNPLTLAFLGDAVHTLFVRDFVFGEHDYSSGKMHLECLKFCRASSQSKALDNVFDGLSAEEREIINRARNVKNHNIPKSSNIEEYKKSTAFEALIGYLYLKGEFNRMTEFMNVSINK